MTINELIEELAKQPDKNLPVVFYQNGLYHAITGSRLLKTISYEQGLYDYAPHSTRWDKTTVLVLGG